MFYSSSSVRIIILRKSSAVIYHHVGVCKVQETTAEIQSCALTWRSIEQLKVINPGDYNKCDHSELWLAQTLQHAADTSLMLYIIVFMNRVWPCLSRSDITAVSRYDDVMTWDLDWEQKSLFSSVSYFSWSLLFVESDVCFCWSLDAVWLIIECVSVSDCSVNLLFCD